MSNVDVLKNSIAEVRFNPSSIQRLALNQLSDAMDGTLDVVDASNPFVFLLETSSVTAAAAMTEGENLTRQQYPSLAVNEEELYLHMSDKDFIGRFATPSKTTFTLLLDRDEAINKAVETNVEGMRKIVIPRNTEFKVSDYVFTMEYPIEVRVLSHGGIQVVYDTTQPSPLQVIESNIVDWGIIKLEGVNYVQINIPLNQFKVESFIGQLSNTNIFKKTYQLTDNFYYARAYLKNVNGEWKEILTTHTDQVFDSTKPTLLLKSFQNSLEVIVPQIYIDNGKIRGSFRIDIYTTKGALDMILANYEMNAFTVNWRDLALGSNDTPYSKVLNTFAGMAIFSTDNVSGGRRALTFDELRERVLTNALGSVEIPITESQIKSKLSNMGYVGVKDIDHITNRVFLATRTLPKPNTTETSSGANCLVSSFQAKAIDLSTFSSVRDNNTRLTLGSDSFFFNDRGKINLVSDQEITRLESLSKDDLTTELNNTYYLMTPFHYVLDITKKYFEVRPYYLDNPTTVSKTFVEENVSSGLYVSTRTFNITRTEAGYNLRIVTRSVDIVKELVDSKLKTFLSFKPATEKRDVFLEGTFAGRDVNDEYIFDFALNTNFDLDDTHNLYLNNFQMFENEIRDFGISLDPVFNVTYFVVDETISQTASGRLTYEVPLYFLPEFSVPVSHEQLGVNIGTYLKGLWNSYRSIVSPTDYMRYPEDVLSFYEETVYERDPNTGLINFSIDVNGNVVYTVLHQKGDPVLNIDSSQVLKHRRGEVMLDENNVPLVAEPRDILRELDIFLYDGRYRFAEVSEDKAYLTELPVTIQGWLDNDIKDFDKWSLEQTELFLYPQRTSGFAKFKVLDSETRTLNLEQSFKVVFYLTGDKFKDVYLRKTLNDLAVEVISAELQKVRITTKEIITKLNNMAGNDVLAIDVSGLGGELDYPVVTIIDETDRCSIKKKIVRDMNGELKVVDDIEVMFVRHVV